MKNSKLSKLLVAGVSVAMLASALAPMAFAEEASGTSEIETALKVYVTAYDADWLAEGRGSCFTQSGVHEHELT